MNKTERIIFIIAVLALAGCIIAMKRISGLSLREFLWGLVDPRPWPKNSYDQDPVAPDVTEEPPFPHGEPKS